MAIDSATEQLYAVLLPLQNDTLLLPNLAVAEVASRESLRAQTGAPAWFAGMIEWQGAPLPVIQFEVLNNGAVEAPGRRARVAVVNGVTRSLSGARFGILCEGYPHLVTLNRAALRAIDPRPQDSADFMLSRVRVASAEALIPDLARIEATLAAMLETAFA